MMPITIHDEAVAAALAGTATPQELRGPDGRTLGRYVPAVPAMTCPEVGLTDDELRRRIDDPDGWVPADQVTARLRALRDSP